MEFERLLEDPRGDVLEVMGLKRLVLGKEARCKDIHPGYED